MLETQERETSLQSGGSHRYVEWSPSVEQWRKTTQAHDASSSSNNINATQFISYALIFAEKEKTPHALILLSVSWIETQPLQPACTHPQSAPCRCNGAIINC